MKILITSVSGDRLTGQITSGELEVGTEYFLEDARKGTNAQNALFHLLVRIYFDSNCFSWPATSLKQLKKYILKDLGEGFEVIFYADEEGTISEARSIEELPEYLKIDPKGKMKGFMKSWSDYTVPERRMVISNLITQMDNEGVTTAEFRSIQNTFVTN